MKRIVVVVSVCLVVIVTGFAQSPSFKTYTNPVIPGDHSDCTVTQIGNDFYTTGSSFNPTPVIYHSTDLVHWEAIAQPVSATWMEYGDAPSGGCWGGQIVYHNNKYWDFFSRNNAMYFVTAGRPEGPWSMPTKMTNPPQLSYTLGYDNSIFIDDNNKWYLLVKNGQPNAAIVELGDDGQPAGAIYDMNWINPKPSFPFSWAEGPVMWKHDGVYDYSFARDVAGGAKVMRSKTLTAEKSAWTTPVDFFNENDPGKPAAVFSKPNHNSAAVTLKDNTHWILHPVWSRGNTNEWYGQGRQGLLNQIHYDGNGDVVADYPVNASFTAPALPSSGIPWMVPHSDNFTSAHLNPEWSFLGHTADSTWSLSERPGWFRLKPKSPTKANTIIKTDAEHNYSLITRLNFKATTSADEAGIRIINGNENSAVKIVSSLDSTGRKVIRFSYDKEFYESENSIGSTLWLKMVRVDHVITGYYSADGEQWRQVGKEVNVAKFDGEQRNYNGWCGNRQGLYVQGRAADFDLYIYRDAYSPILAECPANSFGTTKTTSVQGGAVLDSIHAHDWAMYAGVEFGNAEYKKTAAAIQLSASSAAAGGTVEVWLDAITTGKKIGACAIGSTGAWTTFKTFTAKIQKVTGRHDVYFLFTGKGTNRLMQLQWIQFKSANALH